MIDINKVYKTRDGHDVRLYATDGGGDRPVHGAVKVASGWINISWFEDGRYRGPMTPPDGPSAFDLIRPAHLVALFKHMTPTQNPYFSIVYRDRADMEVSMARLYKGAGSSIVLLSLVEVEEGVGV